MAEQIKFNLPQLCAQIALHIGEADTTACSEHKAWYVQAREFMRDVKLDSDDKYSKFMAFLQDHDCLTVQGDAIAAPIHFSTGDEGQYGANISFGKQSLDLLIDEDAVVISSKVYDELVTASWDVQILFSLTSHQVGFAQLSPNDAPNEAWLTSLQPLKTFAGPTNFPAPRLHAVIEFAERLAAVRKEEKF